jgi:hypothetical protein
VREFGHLNLFFIHLKMYLKNISSFKLVDRHNMAILSGILFVNEFVLFGRWNLQWCFDSRYTLFFRPNVQMKTLLLFGTSFTCRFCKTSSAFVRAYHLENAYNCIHWLPYAHLNGIFVKGSALLSTSPIAEALSLKASKL